MAILRPFRGIMYDPTRVQLSRVVAPPYDVIGDKERQRYYEQDPHNVVRLIAGEVRPTDSAENNKYLRAAGFFRDWLEQGTLRRESQPALFVYQHEFVDPTTGEHKLRQGILGVVELEPFGSGILPHERTHARAKADRLSLTRAVRANLSPIFSMYDGGQDRLQPLFAFALRDSPRLTFEGHGAERHAIWSITDRGIIRRLAAILGPSRVYIADGHHRYETALNFRNKMRAEHPDAPPDAAFNFVLMLLVDREDPGLMILPTHRVIHDVPGFDGAALVKSLRARSHMTLRRDRAALTDAMHESVDTHRIGFALKTSVVSGPQFPSPSGAQVPSPSGGGQGGGLQYLTIDMPRQLNPDPVSALDVTVLHREILQGVVGLPEEALEDERYISYSRDLNAVLERVAQGTAQAAFLLRPPAVSDVVAVASAGQVMPQKSTYFFPKPASGIVFNPLEPDLRIPAV